MSPHFEASRLEAFLATWQQSLLTCQQCHRTVETTTELWERRTITEDSKGGASSSQEEELSSQVMCSQCFPQGTFETSIFARDNNHLSTSKYDVGACDPGRVHVILQLLLQKLKGRNGSPPPPPPQSSLSLSFDSRANIETIATCFSSKASKEDQELDGLTYTRDDEQHNMEAREPSRTDQIPVSSSSRLFTELVFPQNRAAAKANPRRVLPWELPGPRIYESLHPEFLGPASSRLEHSPAKPSSSSSSSSSSSWFQTTHQGEWEAFRGTKREWRKIQSQRNRRENVEDDAFVVEEGPAATLARTALSSEDAFDFVDEGRNEEDGDEAADTWASIKMGDNMGDKNARVVEKEKKPKLGNETSPDSASNENPERCLSPKGKSSEMLRDTERPTVSFAVRKQKHIHKLAQTSLEGQSPTMYRRRCSRKRRSRLDDKEMSSTAGIKTKGDESRTMALQYSLPKIVDFASTLPGPKAASRASSLSSLEPNLSLPVPSDGGSSQCADQATQNSNSSTWLPETEDFERICPGPKHGPLQQHTTDSQQSSESVAQTFALRADADAVSIPKEIVRRECEPSQTDTSVQESGNRFWLPETADFQAVYRGPQTSGDDTVGKGNAKQLDASFHADQKCSWTPAAQEESQVLVEGSQSLPETADFEQICPGPPTKTPLPHSNGVAFGSACENQSSRPKANSTHIPSKTQETPGGQGASQAESSELFPDMSALTETANALVHARELSNGTKCGSANTIVTPAAPSLRSGRLEQEEVPAKVLLYDATGPFVITPSTLAKERKFGEEKAEVVGPRTRKRQDGEAGAQGSSGAFLCQLQNHPFDKSAGSVQVCARTFRYLQARANSMPIQGQHGERIWGDSTLYYQAIDNLRDSGTKRPWLREAPWWGKSQCAPTQTAWSNNSSRDCHSLLGGCSIFVVPEEVYKPIVDLDPTFFDLQDISETAPFIEPRKLGLEFGCLSSGEMISLCQAAGATMVQSASVPVDEAIQADMLVALIPDEIDDEIFEHQLFQRLIHDEIFPSLRCRASSKRRRVSFVYYSWVVESIAAGIVAPIPSFRLGVIES